MQKFIDGLNPAQLEAVTSVSDKLLVLAGAGSGKTRVLVSRSAWLMDQGMCAAANMMALTFTNKAAKEMRYRLEKMHSDTKGMWIGTFHGLSHKILSIHRSEAKLDDNFQIMDADDQLRAVKRIMKELALEDKKFEPKAAVGYINSCKEQGIRVKNLASAGNHNERAFQQIYRQYENFCNKTSLLDFAELLLRSYELLRDNEGILNSFRERFYHILVDEFQDTNELQYKWICLIAGKRCDITAVGDDDQSIYSWRGACVENMQKFRKDFPSCKLVRLEQNYRSTGSILKAANYVIQNNSERVGKTLWTDKIDGEQISIFPAFDEYDEANFVINKIYSFAVEQGFGYKDMAILYRSNAQSRVMEKALLRHEIPYRIFGGLRFFERAEIKNVLAYLRLIFNRNDDASLERIINIPPRGIGEGLMEKVRAQARISDSTLWSTIVNLTDKHNDTLASRSKNALINFAILLEKCENSQAETFSAWVDWVIKTSGLYAMYETSKNDSAKVENLDEMVSACREYDTMDNPMNTFLSNALLDSGETQASNENDYVPMMTLHSSKGLEFPIVFLVGVEEGIFPSDMSSRDESRLEEERRLCYVGITRAMKKLYISYASSRHLYGKEIQQKPSRFLEEIPSEYLYQEREIPTANLQWFESSLSGVNKNHGKYNNKSLDDYGDGKYENTSQTRKISSSYALKSVQKIGKKVEHASFGEGIIVNAEGSGEHERVQIKFNNGSIKWLIASFAGLKYL